MFYVRINTMFLLKRPIINNLILYLLVYASLWFGYAIFVVPVYGYSGFGWAPNGEKVFESIIALVFFGLYLPSEVKRPSDFFVHVHFLLPVIPMLVLYGASDLPRAYMYFVLLAFAVVCFVRKFKLPKIKGNLIPVQKMMWGLLIFAGIYILSIILQGGLRYFNVNLMKVYEFRDLAAHNLPGIFGYLSPMISKIILPFILILAVSQRRWYIVGLAFAGSVMMFALTNHKGPLFFPFLVLAIYWVTTFTRRQVQFLIAGYIVVIFVSLAPFLINKSEETKHSLSRIVVGSLFLRRVMFVPPKLNFVYYDFFSKNPHTMLSQSKLSFNLIEYPYELNSSRLIGDYAYNNAEIGANTGWLGSGYMHFGFAGMLIYSIVIGLLLGLVDMFAKRRELGISVAILFIPFFSLFLSSDLPTAILTHGLLSAMFLTWVCRLNKYG